ncbi:AAA family ATPase [bacterium]|nr:AAA family ATPase [bacterium]
MIIQKVLSPITKNTNLGVLPFRAAKQADNYVDYDAFIKSNAQAQSQEGEQIQQAQAHYIPPQAPVIEPQEMQPVEIQTAPSRGSNLLSGAWSLIKSIGLSILVVLCASKIMTAFGRKGGGFAPSATAGAKELGNKIWEDTSKFPKVEDLALPEGLKKLLDKVKRAVEKPDIVQQRGGKSLNSILLYGPPGTGKTTFAKALANMFPDSKFASLDVTSLGSEYRSVTERNLNNAVDMICAEAEKFPDKKFFVFVDEIDSVMMVDKGNGAKTSNDILNEFKKCFTEKLGKHKNIVTIGATNLDIDIDKATAIGGKMLDKPMLDRFEQKIYVGLPNASQIKQKIISHYKNCSLVEDALKKSDDKKLQILVDTLADEKHNVSFRTLDSLIASAADFDGDTTKVDFKHFVDAIKLKKVELNFTDAEIAKLASDLGVKIS